MTQLQTTWGWLVAVYLFLGGLGAGASIVSHILALPSGERYRATVRFGAWFSAIALGVGSLVLLVDVGKPLRALVLFRSFVNPTSWMARGAWLLLIAMLLNGASALLWTDWSLTFIGKYLGFIKQHLRAWRMTLAILAIPLNLGVAAYTGLLLGALPFRPLWHTPLLPLLFTISALDTGIGLVCAYASVREEAGTTLHRVFEACVIALIAGELTVLAFFIREMANGTADTALSINLWLTGPLAPLFWGGVIAIGLGVPLIIAITLLIASRWRPGPWTRFAPVIGMVACLLGGWTLRYIVLSAGLRAALVSPEMFQAIDGIRYYIP